MISKFSPFWFSQFPTSGYLAFDSLWRLHQNKNIQTVVVWDCFHQQYKSILKVDSMTRWDLPLVGCPWRRMSRHAIFASGINYRFMQVVVIEYTYFCFQELHIYVFVRDMLLVSFWSNSVIPILIRYGVELFNCRFVTSRVDRYLSWDGPIAFCRWCDMSMAFSYIIAERYVSKNG